MSCQAQLISHVARGLCAAIGLCLRGPGAKPVATTRRSRRGAQARSRSRYGVFAIYTTQHDGDSRCEACGSRTTARAGGQRVEISDVSVAGLACFTTYLSLSSLKTPTSGPKLGGFVPL